MLKNVRQYSLHSLKKDFHLKLRDDFNTVFTNTGGWSWHSQRHECATVIVTGCGFDSHSRLPRLRRKTQRAMPPEFDGN